MAHSVKMLIPNGAIMHSDVEFHAQNEQDGRTEVIGKLKVSKGGIEWVAKHKQRGVNVNWKQFAQIMENLDK